jgi:hypothetical protein
MSNFTSAERDELAVRNTTEPSSQLRAILALEAF